MNKIKMMRRRIDRMLDDVREKRRFGDAIHFVDDPTVGCEYIIKNVKSPEDYEDDVLSVVKEIWALKDYLKKALKKAGNKAMDVEKFVNKNYELALCADMANASKHDGLERKRSAGFEKPFLRYSRAQIRSVPNANIELTFEANKVTTNFKNPNEVHYSINVMDVNGNVIGEAKEIMEKAMAQWDVFLKIVALSPKK